MAGLLDFAMYDDPESVGRLAFGAGLLNAAGPQTRPISVGQALSQGLMGAQRASTEAAMNQRRNRLTDSQLHNADLDRQFKIFQIEQARRMANQPPSSRFEKVGDALVKIGPDESVTPVFQGQGKSPAETELAKLSREMNALPPGDPLRKVYEAAIRKQSEFAPPMQLQMPPPVTYIQGMGPDGKPQFFQAPTRAGQQPVPTGINPVPASDGKPMTDTQANASLYSSRMENADKIINDLEGKYSRVWLAGRQMAGEGAVGMVANSRLPPEAQKVDQAQRDFINAVLRRESGAVISPSEFANARQQYFPQPGDTVEVVKQKAANRRTAIDGIRAAAGAKAPVNNTNETPQVIRYDAQGNRIN